MQQSLVTPTGRGVLDPGTGHPVSDTYLAAAFNGALADKGFVVTAADNLITWARTGSLIWMTFGLACCAMELCRCRCRATTSSASVWRRALHRGSRMS